MASQEQCEQIGKAFLQHYYNVWSQGKQAWAQLATLYQGASKMQYENTKVEGQQAIMQHIGNLKVNKMQHHIDTLDCQQSGCNTVFVFVTGKVKIDDGQNAVQFTQFFHLIPGDNGSFWLHNDIFRMIYS
eukprot:CAMPEP_0175090390 /NCGR_PEP_ID=MMETSP0086_2-20121207/1316_1 /TAXON_ID=136419 /ORGANISM="Unknown Unknown, Strain D1" /LENGTH=129 /DNA_ID=CAMNT_0016363007 /DNA_START=88 /DNA_END=477 /DNA_ORIENTATION=-